MRITQAPKAEDKQAKQFFTAVENAEIIENYQAPVHIGDYKGLFVKSPDNGDSIVELTHDLDLRVFEDAITFRIALMVVKYMNYMENFEY
jgi:hypothetical protein